MIIKVKLGDLTARQMKAICDSFDCKSCPLKIIGKKKECFLNFFCSPNADPDTEIEVSTDFMYPEQSEPFDKRIEDIENEVKEIRVLRYTLAHLANILGYEIGEYDPAKMWHRVYEHEWLKLPPDERNAAFSTTEDSFNPPPSQSRCGDCAKFDECKEQVQTDENDTFHETGGCEAFERKESKQNKEPHCDTCLFYGGDGICVVQKEKITRPYKKSCPVYLPSSAQLDLEEKLFQLNARRAYMYNYSFDTTVPCKNCVYCNPRTKKCFINFPKPKTWDGEDGDYYCGHGVERSKDNAEVY